MRRYGLVAMVWLLLLAAGGMVVTPAGVQAAPAAGDPPVAIAIPRGPLTAAFLLRPDLVVTVTGPAQAVTGTEISVKVTVQNKGKGSAPGTAAGAKGYMVDLILSSDSYVPLKPAVYPSYAGATDADFLEDMLMRGGRISNTQTLAAGASAVYTLPVLIPKRTPPGIYCLAAYVDSQAAVAESNETNNISCYRLLVAQAEAGIVAPPATPLWVMPYGVGGTMLNHIKPSGLVDYLDSLDGINVQNAPFGGRLGFRLQQRAPFAPPAALATRVAAVAARIHPPLPALAPVFLLLARKAVGRALVVAALEQLAPRGVDKARVRGSGGGGGSVGVGVGVGVGRALGLGRALVGRDLRLVNRAQPPRMDPGDALGRSVA